VKRCVAILALLFGSGLMSMAGMLVCVYGMPGCGGTPACHQHQQPVQCKSDCCRNGIATSQAATPTQSSKLTPGVMDNATGATAVALMIPVGLRPELVHRSDGPSRRLLTLRV
jgi:hypothetical protein